MSTMSNHPGHIHLPKLDNSEVASPNSDSKDNTNSTSNMLAVASCATRIIRSMDKRAPTKNKSVATSRRRLADTLDVNDAGSKASHRNECISIRSANNHKQRGTALLLAKINGVSCGNIDDGLDSANESRTEENNNLNEVSSSVNLPSHNQRMSESLCYRHEE